MAVTPGRVRALLTSGGGDAPGEGTGTAADMSDAAISEQIRLAELYVAGRTGTAAPFDDQPLLQQVVAAVAAYHCTLAYREGVDLTPGDPVVLLHDWARGVLGEVASGGLDLAPARGPADAGVINPYDGDMFPASDFGIIPGVARGPR